MTPLRTRFVAHLELKGYAAKTRRNYLDPIIQFTRRLKRSPDTLTKDDIQRYLLYLKRDRKLAVRTLNIHIYALKAFCNFILPEADIMAPYSRLKKPKHNPMVLSREEINAVILPHGFMRIRLFGIFANRGRSERLRHCREMLGVTAAIFTEKLP